MKLRHLIHTLGVAALLAPATLLAAEPATDTTAATAKKSKAYLGCERVTGTSIIPSQKNGCKSSSSLPMRAYTQEEIQRTGETDLNQALRKLDPRFQ
jgi:hypothetical protein